MKLNREVATNAVKIVQAGILLGHCTRKEVQFSKTFLKQQDPFLFVVSTENQEWSLGDSY